ncbi:topoisomerase DNA-binding C4 zinc finger domain-containing protein [Vibrio harveyi]|uniref:topoisomerase DNA-binding C4 zinc finger domain-containing protein n=1 Tax=Vibrio harveyi TaxID=669 RepID=UPI002F40B406
MYKRKDRNCWFWSCSGYPECDKAYPDLQGKPDFRSRVKPVVSAHKCQTCNKGLIRRKPPKRKDKYFWACSGYPNCTTTILCLPRLLPQHKSLVLTYIRFLHINYETAKTNYQL